MPPPSGTNPENNINSFARDVTSAVVERAIGFRPTAIEPILGRGMSADVMVAQTGIGRFVVRMKDANWLPSFKKEAWCLEQVHERGIPVPRVIEYGIEKDRAYSVAKFVEGTTPIDAGFDRLRVWETLGRYAKILNDIPVSGFGPNMTSEGQFSLASWKEMFEPEIWIVFRDDIWERRGILSSQQVTRLQTLVEEYSTLPGKAGICQWDMCCENALIRNGDVNDIILLDLDQAVSVLTPHYQIAYVAKARGLESEIMQAFLKGYGLSKETFGESLSFVKRFLVLQSMRSVRWAEDRNPAWIDRNLDNARRELDIHFGKELN